MSQSNEPTNLESSTDDEENDEEENDENQQGGDAEADSSDATGAEAAPAAPPRRRGQRRVSSRVDAPDERSGLALDFVNEILTHMEMDCQVSLMGSDEGSDQDIHLEISGRDAGRVIGKKGQVLSALQFLVNRIVNRPDLERRYVSVDAEGYRSRRDDSLASMARRLGQQAVADGKIITFEPMNPRDRRVVHLALAKFGGVITKSEGEGADRRVQIIPVRR